MDALQNRLRWLREADREMANARQVSKAFRNSSDEWRVFSFATNKAERCFVLAGLGLLARLVRSLRSKCRWASGAPGDEVQ